MAMPGSNAHCNYIKLPCHKIMFHISLICIFILFNWTKAHRLFIDCIDTVIYFMDKSAVNFKVVDGQNATAGELFELVLEDHQNTYMALPADARDIFALWLISDHLGNLWLHLSGIYNIYLRLYIQILIFYIQCIFGVIKLCHNVRSIWSAICIAKILCKKCI